MNKRILIPALVVVLIIIIWGIYRISSNNPISSPALNAVPEDAFMILKSDNILSLAQNISKENKIWQNISVIPQINNLNKEIEQFDSIVTSHSEFEDLLESRLLTCPGCNDLVLLVAFARMGLSCRGASSCWAYVVRGRVSLPSRRVSRIT